jgi:F-type H+-transporting ATPase subunit delta
MATRSSARRYAEAAFQIAEADGTVDEWLDQLQRAAAATDDATRIRRLEDPSVPYDVRAGALLSALGPDVLPKVANLLNIVLRRRRLDMLPRLAREFRHLHNRRAGITEATAISAAPLAPAEVDALRQRLEEIAGGRIELETTTDPSLLGGVQVRLGDRLIDGSVRGRLERLRERLAAGA